MARRVNKKFLVFLMSLTVLVVLLAVAGFYIHRASANSDYKPLVAQADEDIGKGDLEGAVKLLSQVRGQAPDNTEVLVKLGDAQDRLAGKDPSYVGQARIQWNKAVSVDPRCLPALQALLKSYSDELDLGPRPEVFVQLKRVCDLLLNVQPSDLPAQEKKQVAVIHEWIANQTASNDEVRQSIETLLPELIRKDPDNAELPRTLALARIQQARALLDLNENGSAAQVLDQATAMLDAARKGRDPNAAMQYWMLQSYLEIKQLYPGIKTSKEREKAYNDRIKDCISHALTAASAMDPARDALCDDIYQRATEWASQQGNNDEAEKIIRGFYETHRNDRRARLTLARVLALKGDAASRKEAAAILSQDVVEAPASGGFQALAQRELAPQTLEALAKIHMADFSSTPESDRATRKDLAARIDDDLEKLRRLYPPRSVPVLDLEGRFHLLKGENVDAVKTFEEAAAEMPANELDTALLCQLARAYMLTDQPGRARQKLEQVIQKQESAVEPRILLAQVLLKLKELQAAEAQVNKLKALAPDAPEVKQLETSLALANHVKEPGVAASAVAQMPEKTRDERWAKAQRETELGRGDEAARILEDFLKDAPDDARQLAQLPSGASADQKKEADRKVAQDIQVSLSLAQVYANNRGQKENAKRVIEDSLKIHPDAPDLVEFDARLQGRLPEEIYVVVSRAVQKTADPFTRAMQMYQLDSRPGGHPEQAFGHLREANQLKPDDARVLDLMFAHYIRGGKFEEAAPLVEKLAALNADQCGGSMYRYRLALARGDLPAAEEQGRQLTRDYPEFAVGWLLTAQVLQARGKFDEAVRDYLEVLNRQPGHYEAYRGLIECYFRLNQPENAEIRLREAHERYPNDVLLREQWLVYLVNYGKADQAVPEREKILADDRRQQKDVADDYLQLAKAYFHAAQDVAALRPDDSTADMNKAFQALAQGKEKFPLEGRFAGQMAEMYLYSGDFDDGEKVLKELYDRPELKDDPDPPLLLSDFYSRAAGQLAKPDLLAKSEFFLNEAMVKAENKAKEDGPNIPIRLRLASLQAQQGKYEAAYATLNGVGSPADKTDPRVVRQRLEIMIAQGRRDDARKGIRAELARRDAPDLRIMLVSLLIDNHEIDAALKELDHVLAQDPANDAAVYLQSLAISTRDTDRAVSQLVGLRNRDPRNVQVRLLLAELYSKSGKSDVAISELAEALQKMPTNREIRLSLIRQYKSQLPLTNEALSEVVKLCRFAQADPVLRSDPTWSSEAALAYAAMAPPDVFNCLRQWQQAINIAPDKPEVRRQFLDTLIQFHDWNALVNETDKLIKDGHNEWWLHNQRGVAMAHLGQKDKALQEFAAALKVTDVKADAAQGEAIIRGVGENCGHDKALELVTPLLGNDPDGVWRLLQASELRAQGNLQQAEDIVTRMLADPLNNPAERRKPLLRAQAEICQSAAAAETKDPARALAEDLRARDAYVELLGFIPDDIFSLNNVAYLLSERIPAPEGGPLKAKVYSSKAYDLVRFVRTPNLLVLDTHGWVLTLCGGADAVEGLDILHKLIAERDDTKTFIEGRYHLGEAYLRQAKPDPSSAQKWLQQAMDLIANDERDGRPVDPVLKDKVQSSLARATESVTAGR